MDKQVLKAVAGRVVRLIIRIAVSLVLVMLFMKILGLFGMVRGELTITEFLTAFIAGFLTGEIIVKIIEKLIVAPYKRRKSK